VIEIFVCKYSSGGKGTIIFDCFQNFSASMEANYNFMAVLTCSLLGGLEAILSNFRSSIA
jgi:hypothetical protein